MRPPEPVEALLFGSHTATLHEGRVTQFGPTASMVYRRPSDLLSAGILDPPINTCRGDQGDRIQLADGDRLARAAGELGSERRLSARHPGAST